jgi:hypothetical protein
VLAATADRRPAADVPAARIGANELRVGVPFPATALEVLRHACGERTEEVVLGAGLFAPAQAVRLGLVDAVTDPDRLLAEAIAMARDLADGAPAYGLAKRALRAPALARAAAAAAEDLAVARLWASDPVRERIAAALPGRPAPAAGPPTTAPVDSAAFAHAWAAAWNRRDIEAVLAHYRDEIVFSSPVAARVVGGDGVVRGKAALRAYWTAALDRVPDLHFDVLGVYPGQDLLIIHYRNQKGVAVCEVLHFQGGLVTSAHAGYGVGALDPAGVG